MVNQLWQMICKPITTYKLVLNIIIRICQQRLYNKNKNILLANLFYTLILYYQNPVKKLNNCNRYNIAN